MGTFFGVIVFCCCAWWWIRGSAFMAFAVSLGVVFMVMLGAGEVTHHSFLFRAGIGVGVACGPYLIRDYLLSLRKERIVARPEPYGTSRSRITREGV